MFLPEDNHIQTAPKWQTETLQECGWWQSGSKQKHRPFFHANKKKIGLKAVHCRAHFSQGASWGAQRTKKQEDEAVNNLAVRQSHIAGVKTSIPENEAQWSEGRRKWIPEEYQTAAESWAKARQIPMGRSSKTPGEHIEAEPQTMLQSSRQLGNNCLETQACGHRGRGAGSQTATQASRRPRCEMKQQALPAGPTWPPGPCGRGQWHRLTVAGNTLLTNPHRIEGQIVQHWQRCGSMHLITYRCPPLNSQAALWRVLQRTTEPCSLWCRPREREVGNALHRQVWPWAWTPKWCLWPVCPI